MNLRSIVAVSVVAFLAVACGQESATEADGAWVGTITTEGNVTTVVNESGSVWGGTARLVSGSGTSSWVAGSGGPATVSMTGEARVEPLLDDEEFFIDYPRVSPDGRWIAYVANTEGDRVFVRPFPNVSDGRWQVSPDVGDDPIWSIDGSELFYMGGDGSGRGRVLGLAVEAGPPFGVPRVILEGPYWEGNGVQYDVSDEVS